MDKETQAERNARRVAEMRAAGYYSTLGQGLGPSESQPQRNSDHEQAAQGALILHRLIPAPDHGAGFRRDPETGFVYYSSEWLDDDKWTEIADRAYEEMREAENDAKAPE